MFCHAHMSGLFVLDLVFICNGLVCIIVFLCGLDHIGFAFSNFVLLGLVFVQYRAERLAAKNVSETIFLCRVGRETLTRFSSVRLGSSRDGRGSIFLHPTQSNPSTYGRNPTQPNRRC